MKTSVVEVCEKVQFFCPNQRLGDGAAGDKLAS